MEERVPGVLGLVAQHLRVQKGVVVQTRHVVPALLDDLARVVRTLAGPVPVQLALVRLQTD